MTIQYVFTSTGQGGEVVYQMLPSNSSFDSRSPPFLFWRHLLKLKYMTYINYCVRVSILQSEKQYSICAFDMRVEIMIYLLSNS